MLREWWRRSGENAEESFLQNFSSFPGPFHPAALIFLILPSINLLSVAMMAKPLPRRPAMKTTAVAAALVEVGQVRSERTSQRDVTR